MNEPTDRLDESDNQTVRQLNEMICDLVFLHMDAEADTGISVIADRTVRLDDDNVRREVALFQDESLERAIDKVYAWYREGEKTWNV